MNIDPIIINSKVDSVSLSVLNDIMMQTESSSSLAFDGYISIVDDKYKRRKLHALSERIVEDSITDPNVETLISNSISTMSNIIGTNEDITFDIAIKDMFERAEEYKLNDKKLFGFSMGISEIDYMLDGIQPGQLIGFAAYSSQGKTWDMLNIAAKIVSDGGKFCFFSFEMSPRQIVTRLIAILSGVDSDKIKKGQCTAEETEKVNRITKKIKDSGSTIYTNTSLSNILLTIRKEALVNKPNVFLLDYIQLIQDTGTERDVLSKSAKLFQTLMSRVNIPMIFLSQISESTARDGSTDFNPFKGSGDINNSVSTAIYKKSEHSKDEVAERLSKGIPLESYWHVQKNRDGDSVGRVRVFFDNRLKRTFGVKAFDTYYCLSRYEKEVSELDYTKNKKANESAVGWNSDDSLWKTS
jgi:replicative DNA helicase